MNEIKFWCKTICIICIISGVMVSLLPKSKVNSAFKTLIGIMIIYTVLIPVADKGDDYMNNINTISTCAYTEDDLFSLNQEVINDLAQSLLKDKINEYISSIGSHGECSDCSFSVENEEKNIMIVIKGIEDEKIKLQIKLYISDTVEGDVNIEFAE